VTFTAGAVFEQLVEFGVLVCGEDATQLFNITMAQLPQFLATGTGGSVGAGAASRVASPPFGDVALETRIERAVFRLLVAGQRQCFEGARPQQTIHHGPHGPAGRGVGRIVRGIGAAGDEKTDHAGDEDSVSHSDLLRWFGCGLFGQ
jgi:hypothetical protein